MTPQEREEIAVALRRQGLTEELVQWLLALLARVQNLEARVNNVARGLAGTEGK